MRICDCGAATARVGKASSALMVEWAQNAGSVLMDIQVRFIVYTNSLFYSSCN